MSLLESGWRLWEKVLLVIFTVLTATLCRIHNRETFVSTAMKIGKREREKKGGEMACKVTTNQLSIAVDQHDANTAAATVAAAAAAAAYKTKSGEG
jgi:hypothetical protein